MTAANVLYYGDNLKVLRKHIPNESVDLVYLDPPFKSDQNYNVLFKQRDGTRAASQVKAFNDTWTWDEAAAVAYRETVERGGRVSEALQAFRTLVGPSDMLAYLAMMAPRLAELHRVLKPTGSLYLHCDPTASHYLKLLLDAVFGPTNFRNEIVWKRSSAHSDAKQGAKHFGRVSDSLLFYSKTADRTWNPSFTPYDPKYVDRDYRRQDPDGRRYRLSDLSGPGGAAKGNPEYEVMGVTRYWRVSKDKMDDLIRRGRVIQTRPGAVPQYKRYLDEMPGVPVQNLWTDIPVINNRSREKLNYPTQKPEALLERIVEVSSNRGDVVMDPFCGCGTAIAAAQKLGRRWVGIDVTQVAIRVIQDRLATGHGLRKGAGYKVVGEPVTPPDAVALAESNRFEFQVWAVNTLAGHPVEAKKGPDKGVDGKLVFHDEHDGPAKTVVISVKSGKVGVRDVRDLGHVVTREKAAIGVLVTLDDPTRDMRTEAADMGDYYSPFTRKRYPRLQIITVEGMLLAGDRIDMPPAGQTNVTLPPAPKARKGKAKPDNPRLFE